MSETTRELRVGSFVNFIDPKKQKHLAVVVAVLDGPRLDLRVFRTARPNFNVVVGAAGWEPR